LSIQKFKTRPILIFHGDVDTTVANGVTELNPVFLDEPAELAADIGATNIFVGPAAPSRHRPANRASLARSARPSPMRTIRPQPSAVR
jgi:hypothetical protein